METASFSKGASKTGHIRRHASSARTVHGDERRQELIETTYHLIAEKGVGGLRIRDIADHVGVNNATLHYYFPTKDSLLQAVAEQLGYEFTTSPVPEMLHEGREANSQEKMQNYFMSLTYQLQTTPERFIVINELLLAARRDEQLAQVLDVDTPWQAYLTAILNDGVKQGVFRLDLDVEQTALMIMTFCKGLPLLKNQQTTLEKTITYFKEWFFSMSTASERNNFSKP